MGLAVGVAGGCDLPRSYYATPWDLHFRPWSLDITPDDAGNPAFPDQVLNPYSTNGPDGWSTWSVEDWDPALRFWTLPYDPQLREWLQSVDPTLPSILAAREFGGQPDRWQFELGARGPGGQNWLEPNDVAWWPNVPADRAAAWDFVRSEINQLQMLMQDDRDRYFAEADAQADGVVDYFIHFLSIDRCRFPWTVELIACGLAIGNIGYMFYKSRFRRVRASFLCPGLVPPFGPPRHPSFPSGHSFLGHLIALLLLEIPQVAVRYGVFAAVGGPGLSAADWMAANGGALVLAGTGIQPSPLLWLAQRLAKNRERMGFHYPSDSMGSRHIAGRLWWAMLHDTNVATRIVVPTLRTVLRKARAEWV